MDSFDLTGADPVLAARRADRLRALSEELGGAHAVETDVTDHEAVRRLAAVTLERHGRIDGLVNNAGVSLHGPLDRLDLEEFAQVLALNVVAVAAMTQAVLPAMRERGAGRIVNVSSGTTRGVTPGVGGELAPDGIAGAWVGYGVDGVSGVLSAASSWKSISCISGTEAVRNWASERSILAFESLCTPEFLPVSPATRAISPPRCWARSRKSRDTGASISTGAPTSSMIM
ncbi:MAG TPA: SDR family NAD(P)-dependent oxidoreductase [Streptosporangiaceae bacterium]